MQLYSLFGVLYPASFCALQFQGQDPSGGGFGGSGNAAGAVEEDDDGESLILHFL